MIHKFLNNKLIIGGVLLVIIGSIVVSVLLKMDTARFKRQMQQLTNDIQERSRVAALKQSTQEATSVKKDKSTVEKPKIEPTEEDKLVLEPITEPERLQQTTLPVENADEEEVAESAFGFGSFPEVPEGMTGFNGTPFIPEWKKTDYPTYEFSKEFELIDRVMIKKWEEGVKDIVGASFQYNKVYLNYPNTVYVWYEEFEDDEGEGVSLGTSGPISLSTEQIQSGDIPPGVRIIDGKTGGIDPFEYLNLNQ